MFKNSTLSGIIFSLLKSVANIRGCELVMIEEKNMNQMD